VRCSSSARRLATRAIASSVNAKRDIAKRDIEFVIEVAEEHSPATIAPLGNVVRSKRNHNASHPGRFDTSL